VKSAESMDGAIIGMVDTVLSLGPALPAGRTGVLLCGEGDRWSGRKRVPGALQPFSPDLIDEVIDLARTGGTLQKYSAC